MHLKTIIWNYLLMLMKRLIVREDGNGTNCLILGASIIRSKIGTRSVVRCVTMVLLYLPPITNGDGSRVFPLHGLFRKRIS